MDIILAVFLGSLFGFALHRVGAANPHIIINMLRLKDLHLAKVILLAIAISSGLLFIGMVVGLIDPGNLSVKTSYWGVLAGGAIFGIGWVLAGYCPGTGIAAIGDGRKDAIFFVFGGLFGAYIYMITYSQFKGSALLEKVLGGKVTLAATPNESFSAIITGIPGVVVAIIVALALGLIAWRLPGKSNLKNVRE
ncbi:MAG: YeeE/YedE thiosulfate transporter family protein [Planctomycetota bacterium]|jgi:uncharacterized membrane protein YedE/YeeE